MIDLKGKRVLIMGLGRFGGGVGAARFCVQQGANTLVTDLLNERDLSESLDKLAGLDLEFRLGEHAISDFTEADIILVNPAVDPRRNRYIHAAKQAKVTLTTEIQLLIERLERSRVIAITGTAGKSTTTAMVGHILQKTYTTGQTHVGGNIGHSLLPTLPNIQPNDWVVLELSSFMLENITDWSPHIAVATNLDDNHLDRHETMEAYAAAKQNILNHQSADDIAILGNQLADWASCTPAQTQIISDHTDATLAIPGKHNRINATTAIAATTAAGIDPKLAADALVDFPGLPHRLQFVGDYNQVRYYNDSKCTTPGAAVIALDSFPTASAHIILGGYDKNADLIPLAMHAKRNAAAIYTIGDTGTALANFADNAPGDAQVYPCDTLENATRNAAHNAKPGQVVLLSPACASWDQFENYEQRGNLFADYALRFTTHL